MKKKFMTLSVWSFVLALALFVWSYFLYHYMLPDGSFSGVIQPEPGKPFITLLFAVWGVLFLFSGVMSLLIGKIFYSKKK